LSIRRKSEYVKRIALLMGVGLSIVGAPVHADDRANEWVYFGTRGAAANAAQDGGSPQGIYAALFNARTGRLSPPELRVQLPRATWLIRHPRLPVIYAAADGGTESNILGFEVEPSSGKLTQLSQAGAGGLDATHLAFDATSNTLFVANHGSGTVTALPVRPDGHLGAVSSSQKDYGTGPSPRQKMPEPHGVAIDPAHRHVLVTDFGADRIFVYRFDGASRTLAPAKVPYESLPPGSGPRHLAFSPDGRFLYLLTELTAQLRAYRWNPREAHLQLAQAVSTYPADYAGQTRSGGELALSRDGRFLYVSLRGDQDSLVVYDVGRNGAPLREIQRLAALGKSPWCMAIDPGGRWLFVTNEASNSVTLFNIDRGSGRLSATQQSLSLPRPVAVTFYARNQQ
jgi:6-phosphogluconolactonase